MPKMIICRGCPASGKTTWAKKELAQSKQGTAIRLNRDDIRRELFGFCQWNEYRFSKTGEAKVTKVWNDKLESAAKAGLDVVNDDTNLNYRFFGPLVLKADDLGFDVIVKDFFDVYLHELIERNLNREYSVPEDVIHKMFSEQLHIQKRKIVHNDDPLIKDAIIVDVDGTVADIGKGTSWGRSPYDWENVHRDRPNQNVIEMVQLFYDQSYPIIFLSGRDGRGYDATAKWLRENVCEYFELYTREAGSNISDCQVKEELLHAHVLPRYNVKMAIDDRKQIVDHYRALGLEVWQVDHGRF